MVVSSAIKNNPELIEAKRKIYLLLKEENVGAYCFINGNIVVVGSHGKTTTTSLIATIFQNTKLDPTIINGGVINSLKSSAKLGKVIGLFEADEFRWKLCSYTSNLFNNN